MKTRKWIRWIMISVALALITACGGGSSSPVPELAALNASVAENAKAGDIVGSVTVISDHGSPIVQMKLSGTGHENFSVDVAGNIAVASGASLDYETVSIYELTVTAQNAEGASDAVPLTIQVEDVADPFLIAELTNSDPNNVLPITSVAIDETGRYFVVGSPRCLTADGETGCVYVYERDTNDQLHFVAQLSANERAEHNAFGTSVAVSGNYLVVSEPNAEIDGKAYAGCAYVFKRTDATHFTQIDRFHAATPASGEKFGMSVAIDGDLIVVGANRYTSTALFMGEAYLFERVSDRPGGIRQIGDPLRVELPGDYDNFGTAVAISGNYFVIGAPNNNFVDTSPGFALLFKYDPIGNTVSQIAKLASDGTDGMDRFGHDVSIDGDYLIVAAPNANKAYLYKYRSDGHVGLIRTFTSSDARFGSSVSLSGDYILIGDAGDIFHEHVLFYRRYTDTDIVQEAELNTFHTRYALASDRAIAVRGNYVMVGYDFLGEEIFQGEAATFVYDMEPIERPYIYNVPSTPIAYVENYYNESVRTIYSAAPSGTVPELTIEGPDSDWFVLDGNKLYFNPRASYEVKNDADENNAYNITIRATDPSGNSDVRDMQIDVQDEEVFSLASLQEASPGINHYFGSSVAVDGSYMVVGAYMNDRAYLYRKEDNGTMTLLATLRGDDTDTGDFFGISVAISGDYILVGASMEDSGAENSGCAYLFKRYSDDRVYQTVKIKADTPIANSRFGGSVAIDGYYMAIGSPQDGTRGDDAGSLYLFYRTAVNAVTQKEKVFADNAHADDRFGTSVAFEYPYIITGAPGKNIGQGSGYLFKYNGSLSQIAELTASDGADYDKLGTSIDISGDYIVVGAPGDDDTAANSGSAYVFKRNSDAVDDYTQVAKLHAADVHENDAFGASVTVSGEEIVVGSPFENILGFEKAGAAYLFRRNNTVTTLVKKITVSYGEQMPQSYFGKSVAIDGGFVAVGASGKYVNGHDAGMVFCYMRDDDAP